MVAPLWPTLPAPAPVAQRSPTPPRYRKAPGWNYAIGDFDRDAAGRVVVVNGWRAWIEWTVKCCVTQRGWYPVYSDRYGVDLAGAFGATTEAVAFALVADEITTALLADPRTQGVDEFSFDHSGDALRVSFTVRPVTGPPDRVTVEITPE